VYVSFGTFLSARHDVLRQVLRALSDLDARVDVGDFRAYQAVLNQRWG
jgi:UDP:flavonoid glycosyltransferase YjiC (YdhE family)